MQIQYENIIRESNTFSPLYLCAYNMYLCWCRDSWRKKQFFFCFSFLDYKHLAHLALFLQSRVGETCLPLLLSGRLHSSLTFSVKDTKEKWKIRHCKTSKVWLICSCFTLSIKSNKTKILGYLQTCVCVWMSLYMCVFMHVYVLWT